MDRIKIAHEYSQDFLEVERPQPLSDFKIESLINDVLDGKMDKDISDNVYLNFKNTFVNWIRQSKLNQLQGFEKYSRIDIINGCTQFIDNLYMQGTVQALRDDYRYHQRLNLAKFVDVDNLIPDVPLIIAMPFPRIADKHPHLDLILERCLQKNIPVHIDGAWITCCRDIQFNFDHPAISSVGISLSKGLGLGWNRIGLRWSRQHNNDSITIMNNFSMNNRALAMIGLHFLKNLPCDYLWYTHGKRYHKVCEDFNLTPTKSIYLALRNGEPVGVSPLIRYLEKHEKNNSY